MSKINNGGPAFPSGLVEEGEDQVDALNKGMTLRDYFAAKAMQAYISAYPGGSPDHRDASLWVPAIAYEMADAMLEERGGLE